MSARKQPAGIRTRSFVLSAVYWLDDEHCGEEERWSKQADRKSQPAGMITTGPSFPEGTIEDSRHGVKNRRV